MASKAVAKALETAKELNEQQREGLEEAIAEINVALAPYQELLDERQKLERALNALAGGNRLTGAGGTRLSLEQIVAYVEKNPGKKPGEIADHFGKEQTVVSSAMYRNKDKFLKDKNGGVHVRDPEEGRNTENDLEEEDDE